MNYLSKKIEVNKVVNQLEKDQSYSKSYFSLAIIGALIRKKRIEKNLTLDEASKKICSISYLSKIESNKARPNDNCLRLLMEKLEISKSEVIVLENSEELLKKAIEYYKFLNVDSYENIYNLVKDVENNQTASIIKLGYYIMIKDYNNAKDIIRECIEVIGTINGVMIRCLTLFMCEYFLLVGEYDKIDALLKGLLSVEIDYELFYLVKDFNFRYSISRMRPVSASRLYIELVNYFSETNMILRLNRLKSEYLKLLFESKEYSLIVSDDVKCAYLSNFKGLNDEINYIYGVSNYYLENYIESKEFLDLITIDSEYFKKVLFYKYELSTGKKTFIKEIKKKSLEYKDFHFEYFLAKVENRIIEELFTSDLFVECYKNSDSYERSIILDYKRDFYLKSYKYKEANKIGEEIEKLRS